MPHNIENTDKDAYITHLEAVVKAQEKIINQYKLLFIEFIGEPDNDEELESKKSP